MVEGAKDGTIIKQVMSSGEECLPMCVVWPVLQLMPHILKVVHAAAESTCFSSSSTVQTPSGVIAIKNLRLNDLVLTFTPGLGAHYTEVDSHAVSYQNICLKMFAMYEMKHTNEFWQNHILGFLGLSKILPFYRNS